MARTRNVRWKEAAEAAPRLERFLASRRFEDGLEPLQIFAIRAAHGARHQGCGELPEAGRLPTVSQRHSRYALANGFPRVRRLHRERAFGGAHRETFAGSQLDELVRVREALAEELRDEG